MKKAIIAILAFLYITTASGVVVNIHYCMGHVSSVGYGYDNHSICGKCGMEDKQGCCHTEFKLVKLQDAHQLVKAAGKLPEAPVQPLMPFTVEPAGLPGYHPFSTARYSPPPDKRVNEVYLHTLVFRI